MVFHTGLLLCSNLQCWTLCQLKYRAKEFGQAYSETQNSLHRVDSDWFDDGQQIQGLGGPNGFFVFDSATCLRKNKATKLATQASDLGN